MTTSRRFFAGTTQKLAIVFAGVIAASLLMVGGASAQTIISHKGGVAKDPKAKVVFKVTKSPEGAMQQVTGFKITKLRVECGGKTKRITIRAGSTAVTGDDLANEGSFGFTESDLEGSYEIEGKLTRQGAKSKGGFGYAALIRSPEGPVRCLADGIFKTKML